MSHLDGTHKGLFPEIDGTFPNHHPNPVDPETLELLRAEVAAAGADLGIGFDGDGDRIGIIDGKGRQVPGDLLTAFLAKDVAARHPGAPILLDVKSSEAALRLVERAGAAAADKGGARQAALALTAAATTPGAVLRPPKSSPWWLTKTRRGGGSPSGSGS